VHPCEAARSGSGLGGATPRLFRPRSPSPALLRIVLRNRARTNRPPNSRTDRSRCRNPPAESGIASTAQSRTRKAPVRKTRVAAGILGEATGTPRAQRRERRRLSRIPCSGRVEARSGARHATAPRERGPCPLDACRAHRAPIAGQPDPCWAWRRSCCRMRPRRSGAERVDGDQHQVPGCALGAGWLAFGAHAAPGPDKATRPRNAQVRELPEGSRPALDHRRSVQARLPAAILASGFSLATPAASRTSGEHISGPRRHHGRHRGLESKAPAWRPARPAGEIGWPSSRGLWRGTEIARCRIQGFLFHRRAEMA